MSTARNGVTQMSIFHVKSMKGNRRSLRAGIFFKATEIKILKTLALVFQVATHLHLGHRQPKTFSINSYRALIICKCKQNGITPNPLSSLHTYIHIFWGLYSDDKLDIGDIQCVFCVFCFALFFFCFVFFFCVCFLKAILD